MGRNKFHLLLLLTLIWRIHWFIKLKSCFENDIWISFPNFSNKELNTVKGEFIFEKEPIPYNRYSKAFDIVKASINRGDTFLLNLTFPTNLQTNLTLALFIVSSNAKYKLKFKDQFVVFLS